VIIVNNFKPYIPGQPISKQPEPSAADSPDLWQICQQASYPITFDFTESHVTYHNADEAYSDLWTRSLVRECLSLGGLVNK
jgi:hypothetical protein